MADVSLAPYGRVLTPIITPFDDRGAVDYGAFWRLCRHLVESQADAVMVAGAAGEAPTLSTVEKAALFHTAVDAIGGRAHVIAAVGTPDTGESVRLAVHAAEAGCDAIFVIGPPWSSPTQDGIHRHVMAVAEAVELPLVVGNDPFTSGSRVEIDTLLRLSAMESVVAVVDAGGDVEWSRKALAEVRTEVPVYCGYEPAASVLLDEGAVGVLSPAAHVAGPAVARLALASLDADRTESDHLAAELMPVFVALRLEPFPATLKAIVGDLWGNVGEPRPPLMPAAPATREAVASALAAAQAL